MLGITRPSGRSRLSMIWRAVSVVFISGVRAADLQMIALEDASWKVGFVGIRSQIPATRPQNFEAQCYIQVPVRLGKLAPAEAPRLLLCGTGRFASIFRRTARHSGCTLQKATVYHLGRLFAKASVPMLQAGSSASCWL